MVSPFCQRKDEASDGITYQGKVNIYRVYCVTTLFNSVHLKLEFVLSLVAQRYFWPLSTSTGSQAFGLTCLLFIMKSQNVDRN